uniref:uncharacterized protein LOC114673583 n=1 Tax=Macaca mulatta TaxID=9544 RepID=UPI0010A2A2F7|nr:uncharacterized protein LOC114673583 [Macaca mulatta]
MLNVLQRPQHDIQQLELPSSPSHDGHLWETCQGQPMFRGIQKKSPTSAAMKPTHASILTFPSSHGFFAEASAQGNQDRRTVMSYADSQQLIPDRDTADADVGSRHRIQQWRTHATCSWALPLHCGSGPGSHGFSGPAPDETIPVGSAGADGDSMEAADLRQPSVPTKTHHLANDTLPSGFCVLL